MHNSYVFPAPTSSLLIVPSEWRPPTGMFDETRGTAKHELRTARAISKSVRQALVFPVRQAIIKGVKPSPWRLERILESLDSMPSCLSGAL